MNGGVAALTLLLLPALLWGADEGEWLRLAEDGRMIHFMEKRPPVRSVSGTAAVRLKRLFRETYAERAYSVDTLEIDCGRNLYRYMEIVIHDRDGDVMHRYRLTDQLVPVMSGTIPGRVRELVCSAP